jgi:hypothetical protein
VLPTSMRYVALGTDAIVHSRVDLRIELQCEAIDRLESVAPVAPGAAPPPAALHWTLQPRHRARGDEGGPETHSRGRGRIGEAMVRVWDCNTVLHSIDFCCA